MELIDPDNPAVAKFTDLPPKLIEDIHDDPANATAIYRTMAIINDYELYTMRHALTPAQRMDASSNWAKRGGLEAKQQNEALGGGVSITINMPSKRTPSITVESTATEVIDVLPSPDEQETEPRD